jgi:ceramide glucosyltransferase
MAVIVLSLAAASLAGVFYLLTAALAVRRFTALPLAAVGPFPGATILKPLHGAEAALEENLRSFCQQHHPAYQVIFGVREASDAAVPVVRRLIADLPGRDLDLVIDARVVGSNLKVSNLENMLPRAKHGLLVIADSDMRVGPDYLAAVTAPLADPRVGLVTCLYRGRSLPGIWSRLGAMHIDHGFLPSALIGEKVRPGKACFGATIVLRRADLEAIGGFAGLRDQLADDYALGAAVRRLGKRIAVVPPILETMVEEPDFLTLFRHELRWTRTIRSIAPAGHAASIMTHPLALAVIAAAAGGLAPPLVALVAVALAARLAMIRIIDKALGAPATPVLLVPLRDLLSFLVFVASFLGNSIAWRDRSFRLAADGRLIPKGDPSV